MTSTATCCSPQEIQFLDKDICAAISNSDTVFLNTWTSAFKSCLKISISSPSFLKLLSIFSPRELRVSVIALRIAMLHLVYQNFKHFKLFLEHNGLLPFQVLGFCRITQYIQRILATLLPVTVPNNRIGITLHTLSTIVIFRSCESFSRKIVILTCLYLEKQCSTDCFVVNERSLPI